MIDPPVSVLEACLLDTKHSMQPNFLRVNVGNVEFQAALMAFHKRFLLSEVAIKMTVLQSHLKLRKGWDMFSLFPFIL